MRNGSDSTVRIARLHASKRYFYSLEHVQIFPTFFVSKILSLSWPIVRRDLKRANETLAKSRDSTKKRKKTKTKEFRFKTIDNWVGNYYQIFVINFSKQREREDFGDSVNTNTSEIWNCLEILFGILFVVELKLEKARRGGKFNFRLNAK